MKEIISEQAKLLLTAIVDHEFEGSKYWEKAFDAMGDEEKSIARSCFKELLRHKLISALWVYGIPYNVFPTSEGYKYENWLDEQRTEIPSYKTPISSKGNQMKEFDVFISHASKDKETLVDDLYESLNKLGISIFYDKETLEWGDKWKERILEGTEKSEFAIIVISKNFFGREWTERELSEFLGRQNKNGQKIILPILHEITREELQDHYPSVVDIQGIKSSDYTCDQIAILFARQLIKRLKAQ